MVTEALGRIEHERFCADKRAGITRTRPERLAAALVEMAVRATTGKKRRGKRPEPLVCILAGEESVDHILELSTGTVISAGVVIPHLATAQVQNLRLRRCRPVLCASKARSFRGTLRRAIQVRDRHCTHPAVCDEPISACDIDHVTAHAQGGATDEAGGRLQCHAHNRQSDLHDRAPTWFLEAARERRRDDEIIRARVDAAIAADRAPPDQSAA